MRKLPRLQQIIKNNKKSLGIKYRGIFIFKKLFDSIDYASTESAGLLPTSFAENIPYYVSTKNGKIEAKLPIQSYLVLIEGKTSGEIGSVNSFSAEGTQIGVAKPNQPRVKITGKKIALTSNI